jgi:integrase
MTDKIKTVAPGIRLKPNGDYVVTKSINGKRHYFTTKLLPEAKKWYRNFRPIPAYNYSQKEFPTATSQMNGRDDLITFEEVWKKYQRDHLSTLAEETQSRFKSRLDKFAKSLMSLRMCDMNEDVIEAVINERKILTKNLIRCNFNKELKFLNHVFYWYSENIDFKFKSPINEFHKRVGRIKPVPSKPKHIKEDELILFFDKLSGMWKRLAFMQLYMAGRIGEAAGITVDVINRELRKIEVSKVMTWINGRPRPKETTKTESVTYVHLNDHMLMIIDEQEAERPHDCPYLFQVDGEPLRYSWIREAYNQAFKAAGLPYRASHVLRYGMAGIGGRLLGDEGSKAVTRHASLVMARKYRGKSRVFDLTEENQQVVIHAETLFKKNA